MSIIIFIRPRRRVRKPATKKNLSKLLQVLRCRGLLVAWVGRVPSYFSDANSVERQSRDQMLMELEPTNLTRGRFYTSDDRPIRAPHRTEFVHAVRANRTDRIIGWYQSQLNKASYPFHSELERQTMMWMDLDATIRSFVPQPERIPFMHDNSPSSYTPDFRVELLSGTVVYLETKPRAYVFAPEISSRLFSVGKVLRERSAIFKIITDVVLAQEPRKQNIASLQAYRSVKPDPQIAYQIDAVLSDQGAATIGDLAHLCPDPRAGGRTIMSLVYRRHLKIDLNQTISPESLVCHAIAA